MRNFKLLSIEVKIRLKEKAKEQASPAMKLIIDQDIDQLKKEHRLMCKQLGEPIIYPTAKDLKKTVEEKQDTLF
jgi:hypothetical protein